VLWIIAGVVTLLILVVVALQLRVVQNYAAQKAVAYLTGKIKTTVTLETISIGFPKTINLKGLYVADEQNDTLLYAKELNAGIDMFGLLKNRLFIRSIELDRVTGQIRRLYPDTTFNYSFIINAFTSKAPPEAETTMQDKSGAMIIDLKNIKLNEIRFLFNDTLTGSKARIYIGEFETAFKDFDLDKMIFKVGDISLKNSSVSYLQTPPLLKAAEDAITSVLPEIGFKTFILENFKANFLGPAAGNALDAMIAKLEIEAENIDMRKQRISLNRVLLANANISFSQSKPQHFDTIIAKVLREQGIEKEIASPEWIFTSKELKVLSNTLNYRNLDSIPKKSGMDFNNILLDDFNMETSDLYVSPGKINVTLDKLDFVEKSGFILSGFTSKISYDTTNITLADLNITTPHSRISDHVEANFSSIGKLLDSIDHVNMSINLKNSRIAMFDVLYFMPELVNNKQLNIRKGEVVDLNGSIKGTLKELTVDDFVLDNNKATHLTMSGILKNVMQPENMYASVPRYTLRTSRLDIFTYLKQEVIPESVSIPDNLNISGGFEGYIKNFNMSLNLTSTYGNAYADVKMNPSMGNLETGYLATLKLDKLDLGRLLKKPDTLGPLSLVVSIDGVGMDPLHLNAELRANIEEAYYNNYAYRDLNIEGYLVNRSFHGEIWMHDKNLDFNYTGYANANPDSLAFLFDLNLFGADLKALNITQGEMKVQGSISSNLAKRYGPNPLGKVKLYDLKIVKDGFSCPLDSVVIESAYDHDSSFIYVRSEVLNAAFKGDIVLQKLPATLMNHLNNYFDFKGSDSVSVAERRISPKDTTVRQTYDTTEIVLQTRQDTNLIAQNFSYSVTMDNPNLFCKNLLPALTKFTPLSISGTYNSDEMVLETRAEVPMIEYNGVVIDSLYLDIKSDSQKLAYQLHVAEVSNPSIAIEQIDLTGDVSDNVIKYRINTRKADTVNALLTSGAFTNEGKNYTLIIDEPFIFNNSNWTMDPDNMITFSEKGLDAQKVILKGENQLISIITQPGDDVPLKVTFEDFMLSNISLIIEKEKELVRGELNGNILLLNVNGVTAFTSDIKIDSVRFMEVPVGDITLLADNRKSAEQFDVDFALSGNDNDLTIKGFYLAHDSVGRLNLKADIKRLNMATVEPFTFGQLSRTSGFMSGDIDVQGTTDDPSLSGQLRFNEVAFNAAYANTYLKMSNHSIDIRNQRLIVDDLTLTDTLNHTAKINGYADFTDLLNPSFNLRVITEDFLAMNTTSKAETLPVFGKVLLDSDIHVTGTPSSPVVDMKVLLNNGTSVTYIMPESQLMLNESEGIVIFSDSLNLVSDIMAGDTLSNTYSSVEGIEMNASITFEPEAVLKLLIDPVAGDSLFVSGAGTLNLTLDRGGQMNLTGRYDINKGGYNITLNELIKRQFSIKEGSSITWTGDVMDAMVDLNAIYTVRTSPMILLEDQTEAMDDATRNTYRNTLTFMVYLKMKGTLTKPEISFDIEQPEEEKGALGGAVYAKLNELRADETQLNKQVFALLTLNRFLGRDPFESGNAPLTVESATRAGASKILSQQFSTLSEKYIKGVDLEVGVNSFEDYSTGTEQGRTQLELGVSKQFLNDRITVQVGGDVDLEGEQARAQNVGDIANNLAGNVSVEYKLTSNGRYRLKGFRKIEYRNILEGELTRTGVGLIYSRDFRKMRQLFLSKKKLKEQRLERIKEQEIKQK